MSGPRCLFDQVSYFARQRAGRTALITGSRRISYGELDDRARRVRNGLQALKLDRQSRIAILCGNRHEFFEIWQGASMAGQVLTPINARLAAREVAFILNDSQARLLFVDAAFHGLVQEIEGELSGVQQILTLGSHTEWLSYRDWRDGQSADEAPHSLIPPPLPDDTVVQMYTSGTTGFPKGVELGHASILACARSMMGLEAWSPGEVALVTAPLFHTAGSAYAHCALQSGGTVILLEELSPAAVLEVIEKHRVSDTLLVPALIRMVLESPQCAGTDFSSLRRMLYGASPIPVSSLRQAMQVFACDFEQGYGLTECVGPVAMLRPQDHDGGRKMQSCGKAVPGMVIHVVDAHGNECATDEVGEIIVSGPQLMKAYWNRPDDTRDAIRAGWLYTGDAGYYDSDGYLYIHDRLKDMIVSGGENIYPAEVEGVLAACSGIADVAVIGVPDKRWGEAVKALVIPQPGSEISARDITAYAHQHMAGFKCPKSVDFVDSIPRNPSGKILKKVLREPYWAGFDRRVS
jgi:acyl-CoA synthetase (AMP-forming)/AMP-acid ligase II